MQVSAGRAAWLFASLEQSRCAVRDLQRAPQPIAGGPSRSLPGVRQTDMLKKDTQRLATNGLPNRSTIKPRFSREALRLGHRRMLR